MPPKKRKSPSSAARKASAPKKATKEAAAPKPLPVSTSGTSISTADGIVSAFRHIRDGFARYHDRWYVAEDYVKILKQHWNGLDDLTTAKLTRAINNDTKMPFGGIASMQNYMEGNDAGVYANQIETGTGSTKKRKKTWCYLITKKQICPYPPSSRNFA